MDTVIKTNPDAATGKTASEINIDVIQGIIKVVVADYIDSIIDATWESYAMGDWEYMDDGDGNLYGVIYTYDEGALDHIYEGVEEACYDKCGIDLYEWEMENDIDIQRMIDREVDNVVVNNNELAWFGGCPNDYIGVFYKNKCDMMDEIREYVEKAAEEVFFTPMKTQFEWFFDEETMLEEDGDGSLIAVVGAFEGEEYDNVYNAVRKQWENDTNTDLDKCCSIVDVDIEYMIYDVVDTIVEDSRNMKWKDNSDRILGFIYNENNELAA